MPAHYKRLGRELAMQFLFQNDVRGAELSDEACRQFFWAQAEDSGAFPVNRQFRKGRIYAERLIEGVLGHLEKIDGLIVAHSEKWDLKRMAVVDRNVMRIAVYEMLCCPEVPPLVSINEAIEIAKDFGSEKSGGFINGVLNGAMIAVGRQGEGKK